MVFTSSPYEACNRMARFLRCLWGVRRWEAVVPGEPRKRVVGHLRESTSASLPQIETMDMTRRSRSAPPPGWPRPSGATLFYELRRPKPAKRTRPLQAVEQLGAPGMTAHSPGSPERLSVSTNTSGMPRLWPSAFQRFRTMAHASHLHGKNGGNARCLKRPAAGPVAGPRRHGLVALTVA